TSFPSSRWCRMSGPRGEVHSPDRPGRLDRLTGAVRNLPIQVTPHPMVHDDIGDANRGEALRELLRDVVPSSAIAWATAGFMRSAGAEPAERTPTRPRA